MSFKRFLWLSIFMALMFSMGLGWTSGHAGTAPAKTDAVPDWYFHDIISVDFVKDWAKVPQPENVMIIDSRPKHKYASGHIPTAINIPDSQFDQFKHLLPEKKSSILIFYCMGPTWKLSHKSAWKAEKLGYKNVKVFAEGFPAWMKVRGNYASVSEEYVAEQIDTNKVVVVDSRPYKPKYVEGHIPTDISIPDSQFDELKGKLPHDTSLPLIFYCGGYTWKLSHQSARKAVQLGYSNVKVFAAGYPAWVKFAGTTGPVKIKAGKQEGSIEIATFEKILKEEPDSIHLIDVRDPDEFKAGTFKTAVNIPTDKLEKNIKSLPNDKPIIFVCNTGAKSGEAYYMVQDLRPELKKVYYLDAEVKYNKDGTCQIKKTP